MLVDDVLYQIMLYSDIDTIKYYCGTSTKAQSICHNVDFWHEKFSRDKLPIFENSVTTMDWIMQYKKVKDAVDDTLYYLENYDPLVVQFTFRKDEPIIDYENFINFEYNFIIVTLIFDLYNNYFRLKLNVKGEHQNYNFVGTDNYDNLLNTFISILYKYPYKDIDVNGDIYSNNITKPNKFRKYFVKQFRKI
jgi:hypothetical protein